MKPGTVIDGKYRLDHELGSGGIGTVWKAWQPLVERWVAIKVLRSNVDERARKRFAIEAQALGRLNHPNCIQLYEFGYSESQRRLFLAMEFVEGQTIYQLRGQSLPVADVVEISRQIATALAYAHHQGVAHRDLKPENVMLVDQPGGEKLVKVLDFGLARLTEEPDERVTRTGEIFGTPAYMSPEQVRGTRDAGPSSDLYSLGIMMFEMLEGKLPFDGESSFDLLAAHVAQPIPALSRVGVPPELATIVHRLLQKKPADRYASALDLWHALTALEVDRSDQSHRFVVVEEDLRASLASAPAVDVTKTFEDSIVTFDSDLRIEYESDDTELEPLLELAPKPAPSRPGSPSMEPAAARGKSRRTAWAAAAVGVVAIAGVLSLILVSAGEEETHVPPEVPAVATASGEADEPIPVATQDEIVPTKGAPTVAAARHDMGDESPKEQTSKPEEPAPSKSEVRKKRKQKKTRKISRHTKSPQKSPQKGISHDFDPVDDSPKTAHSFDTLKIEK